MVKSLKSRKENALNINNTSIVASANNEIVKKPKIKTESARAEKTETDTVEKFDADFMSAADRIYGRIGSLKTNYTSLDRMNARNVVSLASSAICKGNDIHTSLSNIVYRFQEQISRILLSGGTKEEIESKIKAIEDKMNAAAKEANAKMDILISLSDSLFKLGNIALDMKNNDMNSYNGVEFIKQLIEKLDTKVDDFSRIETSKEKINEKISKDLDNIYGKESREKLEKKKEEFEDKTDEIKDALQNPNITTEEANRLKALLDLYIHRIDAISNILDIFDQFSSAHSSSDTSKE